METPDAQGLYEDEKDYTGPERMAAYQNTIIAVNAAKPCCGVFTYNTDEKSLYGQYFLLKILPFVRDGELLLGPSDAIDVKTFDCPGKVISRYRAGSTQLEITFSTLLTGADSGTQSGGWQFQIRSEPARRVSLRIGEGKKSSMVGWKKVVNDEGKTVDLMTVMSRAVMVSEKFRQKDILIDIRNSRGFISGAHPFTSGIVCDGVMTRKDSDDGGQYLCVDFPEGSGTIYGVFSRDPKETASLLERDFKQESAVADAYYNERSAVMIDTPEPSLNEAFHSAVMNMDYSYLAPYGWIESIHHWMSMWHQQYCLAADWIGQQDRSRQVISSQAKALYPSGAAPMFYTNGEVFCAFGGTDHFYLWQVRHYLLQTDDRAFARWILPYCEKVLEHSLTEYVPGGELRWNWGEQIGNQEDYISHLFDSASPTIEGINMLTTLALVSHLADDPEKHKRYEVLAAKARKALDLLWDDRLARFIYQMDTTGKKHLEGQYQTYIYPYLYDMLDETDAYISFRHLRERLLGSQGELYCSNNFPNHMAATLGTQAGMAQQPWGAMACAKMGEPDLAVKPLRFVANIVSDPKGCAGSWPEAADSNGCYYSPPAAVFIQSVVEYIYGLRMNRPEQTIVISPSFPSDWPHASMHLPEYSVRYTKKDKVRTYAYQSDVALSVTISWRLPPCTVAELTVDDAKAAYELVPCVNGVVLHCSVKKTKAFTLRFHVQEAPVEISYKKVVAEGETFSVLTKDRVVKILDPSGILAGCEMQDEIRLSLKDDIITPYLRYGRLGLVNFSARTVFLVLKTQQGVHTIYPLDLTVIPARTVQSELSGNLLGIQLSPDMTEQGAVVIGMDVLWPDSYDPQTNRWTYSIPDTLSLLPGRTEAAFLSGGRMTRFFIRNESIGQSQETDAIGRAIALPESLLENHDCWKQLKRIPFLHHMPWLNQKDPLEEFEDSQISHPALPLSFPIQKARFIPLSYQRGGSVSIPVAAPARKFFVLLFSFLDNHDVFSPVLRITTEFANKRMASREYHYPGDLDGFWASSAVGCFSTAHSMQRRKDDPLVPPDELTGQWPGMRPVSDHIYYFTKEYQNSFPSSLLWSDGYSVKLPCSVAGIVEFDLKGKRDVTRIILESLGTNTAFGILSVISV